MKNKVWLVYLVFPCEMGAEGYSGWMYYCVAEGNTDEEIYNNWIENVKKIYGVDLSKDLRQQSNDLWTCYYPLEKNELPLSVYGNSERLEIKTCYSKHESMDEIQDRFC